MIRRWGRFKTIPKCISLLELDGIGVITCNGPRHVYLTDIVYLSFPQVEVVNPTKNSINLINPTYIHLAPFETLLQKNVFHQNSCSIIIIYHADSTNTKSGEPAPPGAFLLRALWTTNNHRDHRAPATDGWHGVGQLAVAGAEAPRDPIATRRAENRAMADTLFF